MKWQTLGSVRLVDRPWVGVREDRVRFDNGLEQDITVVENRVGVHVLAVFQQNIVLVDKVNYPGGQESSLELPGGVANSNYLLTEALREFSEETSLEAGWCRPLITLHPGAFRLESPSHIFLATDIRAITDPHWKQDKDENELINRVVLVPLNEAVAMIGHEISDTLTAATVLWLKNETKFKNLADIY